MNAFEVLKGMTLKKITGKEGDDRMTFDTGDRQFALFHSQDCCESVTLAEVVGELNDLIGSPLLEAEEVTNESGDKCGILEGPHANYYESWTWTFYKLATIKGSVTLRWLGESNGYYSEHVDFEEVST